MSDNPRLDMAQTYARVFSTVEGRLVLDDLRLSYGDRRSFDSDPYVTAFREGQRDVYLAVCDLLAFAHDPAGRVLTVVGAPAEEPA